jgi:hypothetical protein
MSFAPVSSAFSSWYLFLVQNGGGTSFDPDSDWAKVDHWTRTVKNEAAIGVCQVYTGPTALEAHLLSHFRISLDLTEMAKGNPMVHLNHYRCLHGESNSALPLILRWKAAIITTRPYKPLIGWQEMITNNYIPSLGYERWSEMWSLMKHCLALSSGGCIKSPMTRHLKRFPNVYRLTWPRNTTLSPSSPH